jgi:subtilase family serine protease
VIVVQLRLLTKHVRLLSIGVFAALALLVAAGSGSADPGGQVSRDHEHGAWFRRVCDISVGQFAGCQAQVVSDASGDPLAGSTPPAGAVTPAKLVAAYNLPSTPVAGPANPTVAIVDAYNDPNIQADLTTFSSTYNLPPCTAGCFTKIDQNGGTNYPATNSGWDLEIALDVETVHAICPACHILLVEASSNSTVDLGIAENQAASQGAVAISNSWGAGESSGQTSWDTSYFKHSGVAITASTGDSGYGVEWPASSPYVTAVGGTTLTVNGTAPNYSYGGESAWVDGGSGCSSVESQPLWQANVNTGCSNRSVADVAADADPNTGAAVYDSIAYQGGSGWFQVGGTSLSSPIIASVYALAGNTSSISDGSTPYGHLGDASMLHDVTKGSNGSCSPSVLCTAGSGYDGPTGVGTPNGVLAFSPAPAAPPTPDYSLSTSVQNGPVVNGTGGNVTYTVTITDKGTFNDSVSLSTGTTLPGGVTGIFSPSSPTSSSTLTLSVPAGLSVGTYPFTITGTSSPASGSISHSVNATLVVSAPTPNFKISITPSQTVSTSGSTTYTVTITPQNGFSGSVSLSVNGAPRRVSTSFSPTSASAPSWTSTLKVTANRASRGTYTLTVTGRNGSLSHSASATLIIGP